MTPAGTCTMVFAWLQVVLRRHVDKQVTEKEGSP